MIFARKILEFYVIYNCPKKIFSRIIFWMGARAPPRPCPPSAMLMGGLIFCLVRPYVRSCVRAYIPIGIKVNGVTIDTADPAMRGARGLWGSKN